MLQEVVFHIWARFRGACMIIWDVRFKTIVGLVVLIFIIWLWPTVEVIVYVLVWPLFSMNLYYCLVPNAIIFIRFISSWMDKSRCWHYELCVVFAPVLNISIDVVSFMISCRFGFAESSSKKFSLLSPFEITQSSVFLILIHWRLGSSFSPFKCCKK